MTDARLRGRLGPTDPERERRAEARLDRLRRRIVWRLDVADAIQRLHAVVRALRAPRVRREHADRPAGLAWAA